MNEHEQARELIALADDQSLPGERRNWLRNHLRECASCAAFAETVNQTVGALRSQPQAANHALVQATQRRLRRRSWELRQQQERTRMACLACLFAALFSVLTTPLFWRACQWMGQHARLAAWIWQAGFAFLWIVPALVVSALLLAHGTHLSNDETICI